MRTQELIRKGKESLDSLEEAFRQLRAESAEIARKRGFYARTRTGFLIGFHLERAENILHALLQRKSAEGRAFAQTLNQGIVKFSRYEGADAFGEGLGKLFAALWRMEEDIRPLSRPRAAA